MIVPQKMSRRNSRTIDSKILCSGGGLEHAAGPDSGKLLQGGPVLGFYFFESYWQSNLAK